MTIHNLYLPRLIDDKDLDTLKGQYIDDEWIHHIIDYDCNIYEEGTDILICAFRKRRLKKSHIAWEHFKDLSVAARGRGAAAGPIDPSSTYWKKRTLHKTNGYKTGYLKPDGTPSKMSVNNQVSSTPIGYFEKQKNLGIDKPCRLTYHTTQSLSKYEAGIPYIQEIDKWYQKLHPTHYKNQLARADLQPNYKIADTAFSTVTMNRNFRTGLHKDAGDWGGYAMLSVLEYGKYNGGLFTIPAFGIGINVRKNDVLCGKVSEYHSNTQIWTTPEQDTYNASIPRAFKKDTTVGTLGLDQDYARISFVSYLREKLIHCD